MSFSSHGRNLRKGRFSETGFIYLVTTRCANRKPLFSDYQLGQIIVDEIFRSDRVGFSKTFAFVVMPDHMHWLFQLMGDAELKCVIQSIKGRTSRRINLAREETSPVWQSGFYDRALRRMESLHDAGYYILHNPVRAGLVEHYSDYKLLYAEWL